MRRAAIIVMFVVLGIGFFWAPRAGATFPGRNGDVMYTWHDVSGKTIETRSGIQADLGSWTEPNLVSCAWRFADDDCLVTGGAVSADGRRVAVVVDYSTTPHRRRAQRVAVVAPSGREVASVPLGGPAFHPAWSPTGDRLLVTRYDGPLGARGDGVSRVVLLSVDGRELGAITPEGGSDADWAGTGAIAFTLGGNIWVTRLGEAPRRLTTEGGTGPSWSPDGKRLAFERDGRLWTMRSDGANQRQLARVAANAPAWSPDGRYITFSTPEANAGDGYGDIWVMSSEGRCPRLLRNGHSVVFYGDPFWRPLPVERPAVGLPPACRYLHPDMRSATLRVRAQQTSFRYRFRAKPRIEGRAIFRTRARISVPGRNGTTRRRLTVATARFTAGPRGAVRLRPRLSRTAMRTLRANRRLRLTVVATVHDDVGAVRESAARKRLLLLAPGK